MKKLRTNVKDRKHASKNLEKVDALTGMFAMTTVSFITQPEGIIDPSQIWTIPALTVLLTALTAVFYKQNQKRQLTKSNGAN